MDFRKSLKEFIFGNKTNQQVPQTSTRLQTLSGSSMNYLQLTNLYNSDIVRSCIDTIARNAAKLKPRHVKKSEGSQSQISNSELENVLAKKPNPLMDAYSFYYKVVTCLFNDNNAFIFIHKNIINGKVMALYPVPYSGAEFYEYDNEIWVKLTFTGGQTQAVKYEELIHLRRFFYKDDLFGNSNCAPLQACTEAINATNHSIIYKAKNSGTLRGLLKFTTMLKAEDIQRNRDNFVKNFLQSNDENGIGALDITQDFVPLNNNLELIDKDLVQHTKTTVHNYFGINEKIINSSYSEQEWTSFYNSVIEPIALQLSLQFTNKVLTEKQKQLGQEIIFSANRLTHANNATKVQMARELMPLSIFTINEIREIFELEQVEGGDIRIMSLNNVDASKANEYQIGSKGGEDKKDDNGEQGV